METKDAISKNEAIDLAEEIYGQDYWMQTQEEFKRASKVWDEAKAGKALWHEAYAGWYSFYKKRGEFLKMLEDRFMIFIPDRRAFNINASDGGVYSFFCHRKEVWHYTDGREKDAPMGTDSNRVEKIYPNDAKA